MDYCWIVLDGLMDGIPAGSFDSFNDAYNYIFSIYQLHKINRNASDWKDVGFDKSQTSDISWKEDSLYVKGSRRTRYFSILKCPKNPKVK